MQTSEQVPWHENTTTSHSTKAPGTRAQSEKLLQFLQRRSCKNCTFKTLEKHLKKILKKKLSQFHHCLVVFSSHPSGKICSSNWIHNPQFSGFKKKTKKYLKPKHDLSGKISPCQQPRKCSSVSGLTKIFRASLQAKRRKSQVERTGSERTPSEKAQMSHGILLG